jgi:hypothetical protein
MAFYFSLLSLSEELDLHIREIDKLYRRYNSAIYEDERKAIEKAINEHIDSVLKRKDRVLKLVDKELRKQEKKIVQLEKKVTKAERKNNGSEELRKELGYALEEIDVIKAEAAEHIPESLLSLAFIDDSLQADGDYFTIDLKNFLADLFFLEGVKRGRYDRLRDTSGVAGIAVIPLSKRRRYDRLKVNGAELYVNGRLCNNFDIIYRGKAYAPNRLEGLRIKEKEIISLRIYEKFFDGVKLRFVIETERLGVLSFEKELNRIL